MPRLSPSRCTLPVGTFYRQGEEESPVTSWLLDYADVLGTRSPLTTWFAWALQRHQEANEIYIDGKLSELQASLEHAIARVHAGTQTHDDGRLATAVAAVGPAAGTTIHEVEFAGEWPAFSKEPSKHVSPAVSERKSLPYATTTSDPHSSLDDVVDKSLRRAPPKKKPEALESKPPLYPIAALRSRSSLESGVDKKALRRAPSMTKGACDSLALDGAVESHADDLVPLPSALISTRGVLGQFFEGGDCKDHNCQTQTLRALNIVGVFMVTLNAILIFLELEKQGAEIAKELGIVPDATHWDSMGGVFRIADFVFNGFYVTEMVVKLTIMRGAYIKDPMNILDAIVAVLNTVDLIVLKSSSGSIVLARLARFIKVAKLIRLSRILRVSHELCSLISTLYLSLRALAAAAVLLVFIVLITGLGMSHFVSQFLMDECSPNVLLCDWAYKHYGSGSRASWSMFQVTLSGGWPMWADQLVERVSWFYIFFWVVYIIVVWFGVLRVITALFIKQTMEIAAADQEMMDKEKLRKKAKHAATMRDFFAAADVDGDGFITYVEFEEALLDESASQWLKAMDIEHTEINALFQMLDDGDGYISFDELLASAARLGGSARASDQMAIIRNQRLVLDRIDHLVRELGFDSADASVVKNRSSNAVKFNGTMM